MPNIAKRERLKEHRAAQLRTLQTPKITELGPLLIELTHRFTSIDFISLEPGDWCVSCLNIGHVEEPAPRPERASGCGPSLLIALQAVLGKIPGKLCSSKECQRIRGVQDLREFAKHALRPDGHDNYCRSCRNAMFQVWKSKRRQTSAQPSE